MGVSMVGCYHYRGKRLVAYRVDCLADLTNLDAALKLADRVVGFNLIAFDLPALAGVLGDWVTKLPTCDLMQAVVRSLHHRLSLNHLALATLGRSKRGDGLDAIRYYQDRERKQLERYCLEDVEIMQALYDCFRCRSEELNYDEFRG